MSTRSALRKSGSAREGAHVVEMQRRRLLLAIVEVASESGLEAATVGRICGQASVSRRTFYELFDDRHACLLAAFDAEVRTLGAGTRAVFEGAQRWDGQVRDALTVLLEHLDAEPHVARFCLIEVPRAGGESARRHRHVMDALALIVSRGVCQGRGEPPPLTAQGIVGGALSVIQGRILECAADQPLDLISLTGPLMAMIVQPYLGVTAAQRELDRPVPSASKRSARAASDPFKDLPIRFTYRTARVLDTIAGSPGASNRLIADASGINDDGQVSRLLARLSRHDLIENTGLGHVKGEPNAWSLTERGTAVHATIAQQGA